MQIKIEKNKIVDPVKFLRRAGYGLLSDRRGGSSFVRRLDRDLYPRFHIYVEDKNDCWFINLHLDQKAPVYKGVTAHSGEYDGEVVEREAARIEEFIKNG